MSVLMAVVNAMSCISAANPKESNSSFPLHWLLIIAVVPLLVFAAISVICCSYKKLKKGIFVLMK